ncbi:Acetate--CoA ligase [Solidesulfovibrio carbinoliphilus subsp. oakridgensis]|uniref:Acetate--CoA ligase n=1 Tax=Solidesulfovibrio carbinoliphilus subsp. oakridgensis TaxID=694327 RepID=G7Q8X5_9BACT|nr:acetate--CoA ligase [Solidesulfovibrio carbinoliphilus]EHJ47461.1 Acetate--CoA ligase [Solidesulfovibrio carbinoliphilus subsp. oakridgensis]
MTPTGTLDALLVEERVFRPAPATVIEANVKPADLAEAYRLAEADHLAYWEKAALELEWHRKWDAVLDDGKAPFYRWFPGARTNIVHNALDRHVHIWTKNKLALIWEGEAGDCRKFTYFELYREVNRLAGALRALGVSRGDRVCLYMPPIPETVVAMLAAAKIGAVHVFVFAGYSAKFLRERLNDSKARVLVTADGFYRGGRCINLKAVVDEALPGVRGETAETVVVVRRTGDDIDMQEPRDLYYHDLLRQESPEAATEIMEAGDPLFWLHTSGTTGRPKAVVHNHGGYMVGASHTFRTVFDIKPTDIHFCTADPGWITGHTYGVYGPLLTGATVILYEGHPLYPQADRLPTIIERYGATIFYATPTLVRMLMRYGPQYPKKRDLSTLRLLGSVGEPLGPEAWMWFYKHIGRSNCPVLDTWWQTETGMAMISPMPISVLKPGSVGKALPGIAADVVDDKGQAVPPGQGGFLVVKKPWPAMLTTLEGDDAGYARDYWERIPGCYFAGDVARRDEDGYFWIQGRADDVLNIAGHRVGTAEVEAALCAHRLVTEAAVVGLPDKIKGEVAKAFVVAAPEWRAAFADADAFASELRAHVRRELGPIVVIKAVELRDTLPRTRSGKILRRKLRAEELGQALEGGTGEEE